MNKIRHHISRIYKAIRGKDLFLKTQVNCSTINFGNAFASWTINPDKIDKNSIIYSFGIGEDISWDMEMIKKFGVTVYAFDPTPKSHEWLAKQSLPVSFKHKLVGLSDYDGIARFELPANPGNVSASLIGNPGSGFFEATVKTLSALMKENNHRHIDILKMDIEGAEYGVIENLIKDKISIDQILIEFHHRFKNIGAAKTRTAINSLNHYGYKIFDVSKSGEEVSLIRMIP